ncbi:TauD/TfdA dioxygenase family protein [Ramlibacter humi]|nr:TauD/TfdA family dioxygenase [Ramlibacter humi]
MTSQIQVTGPLPGARFGATVRLSEPLGTELPTGLPQALADAGGLLLIPGLGDIGREPQLLVKLSYLFGTEVENYRAILKSPMLSHPSAPEIFMVTNMIPGSPPSPALPVPPLTPEGRLPVQYPQRFGWHSDQSYRNPAPDISVLYAQTPVARGRGQTIFASGTLAYDALPEHLREKVENLQGMHCKPGAGRDRRSAESGKPSPALAPDQFATQPVVRIHPVTGKKSLFLCERAQMDWFDGPFVGMQPGPDGEGARLLDELLVHYTRPEFTYVHEWTQGDVLVWDNRCLIHTATWYDAAAEQRMMWRTTVRSDGGATVPSSMPEVVSQGAG